MNLFENTEEVGQREQPTTDRTTTKSIKDTGKQSDPGEENFSAAPPSNLQQYFPNQKRQPHQAVWDWLPDGPWKIDGKLDGNFRDHIAKLWIAQYGGDIHANRANVLSHFKKDPANLPIRWEQYQGEYLQRYTNVQSQLAAAVPIDPKYQEQLTANARALTPIPDEINPLAIAPAKEQDSYLLEGEVVAPSTPIAPAPEVENAAAYQLYRRTETVEPDKAEAAKLWGNLMARWKSGELSPNPIGQEKADTF